MMYGDIFRKTSIPSSPPLLPSGTIVEWWRNDEIELRIKKLGELKFDGFNVTPIGIIQTAQMLWEYRDDKEKVALVWVAASLWQVDRDFPYHWRGSDCSDMVSDFLISVLDKMNDTGMSNWNGNTKHTLPINLFKIYKVPEFPYELFNMIVVNCIVSNSLWTLVEIDISD